MTDDFRTHVHGNGLPTEVAAFNKASKRSASIKFQILVELRKAGEGGLTPDEFVLMHGGLINTIRRRFTDLWKDGKIRHHPTLLSRKNLAGNDCVSWVIGTDVDLPVKKEKKWVGLTELEKAEITSLKWWDWEDTFDIDGFIKAIEAKLKEKNT